MKYLRVIDLLARHCKLPQVDVPNIAYYDCRNVPDWSVAFNSDITTQLICSVTFMDGTSMERVCRSLNDIKLFVKDANYYASHHVKLQTAEPNERYKRAEEVLKKLIKQAEDKKNA